MQNLFVYGTLLYPKLWRRLVRRNYRHATARLADHRRLQVKGERYPGLIPCKGCGVEGRVYFNIQPQELRRLDGYEGEQYEHKAVTVVLEDGTPVTAITYLFKKRYRARLASREWSPSP
jgi:gamma-glutamylcyclotransferase (GGCT)/AIG2-like uncharacterized protein YtfP